MKIFKLWSVIALMAYFILLAVEGLYSGPIFFHNSLGGNQVGLVPNLVFVCLIIDIIRKKIPAFLLMLPVVFYGTYYSLYFYHDYKIKNLSTELRSKNPVEIIQYDPQKFDVFVDSPKQSLIQDYKIPVIYTKGEAHRLASASTCAQLPDIMGSIIRNLVWFESGQIGNAKKLTQCIVSVPENPDNVLIKVVVGSEPASAFLPYNKNTFDFYLQENPIGTFVTATADRLLAVPTVYFRCYSFLRCSLSMMQLVTGIESFPEKIDKERYGDNPIGAMLKIERYKEEDFDNYQDYPENKEVLDKFVSEKGIKRQ